MKGWKEKKSHAGLRTEGGETKERVGEGRGLKIEPWQQSEVSANETGRVTKAPSQFINQSRPAGRQQPEQPENV